MNVDPEALSATASTQHDDSGLPYRLGVLGERVPAPAPWPPTGQIIEVTFSLGSAATARCRTATSCALSGAHSSTRPVRGELGSAPRPAAGEHERSPIWVTRRSEQNVKILSEPLVQRAFPCVMCMYDGYTTLALCLNSNVIRVDR